MAGGNWIKVNRCIQKNWIWDFKNPKLALAWLDMLMLANYEDKKIQIEGKPVLIRRGTFITSMVKLGKRWDVHRKTVARWLDVLQEDGMLSYKCTCKYTAITIENYSIYQDYNPDDVPTEVPTDVPTQVPSDVPTDVPQHKNIKKDKEVKEIKKYSDVPELNAVICDFIDHRKKMKSPMTDRAVTLMLNKLDKLSSNTEEQIEILNQSIFNGWKGIFPLKDKPKQENTKIDESKDDLDDLF